MDPPSLKSPASAVQQIFMADKPTASAGGITCSIILAEPYVYVHGFEQNARESETEYSSAMIRGKLVLNVTKSVKIKAVTLIFSGKARTEWPDGITPDMDRTFHEERLIYQALPFYNAQYPNPDSNFGAQCTFTLRGDTYSPNHIFCPPRSPTTRSSRSSSILSSRESKRLSGQSRTSQRSDTDFSNADQQKGYKTFPPGVYEYTFEIPFDHIYPESAELPNGSVRWKLEALIERAGVLKSNLHGCKEVLIIRAPDQNSLEQVEPIAISRKWEDQLYYDIIISGKSFAIGSKIPVTFKLTPLAKVQCHRIRVLVTESITYFCPDRDISRKDSQRQLLLMEKHAGRALAKDYEYSEVKVTSGGEPSEQERRRTRAMAQERRAHEAEKVGRPPKPLPPPSDNLLGDLDLGLEELVSQTEIEMNIQLPTCDTMRRDKSQMIHPNITSRNMQVQHWIKIVLRLSRVDKNDPTGTKRRHFEISIDSPLHILSCLATQAHTTLPEYTDFGTDRSRQRFECGCPNAAVTKDISPTFSPGTIPAIGNLSDQQIGSESNTVTELSPPPQAHLVACSMQVERPIRLSRNPSYGPPPFDDDEPPPPAITPPPVYDHLFGSPSQNGLADYFQRFADAYSEDNHIDEPRTSSYVNMINTRTLGGSMGIDHNFMFCPEGGGLSSANP